MTTMSVRLPESLHKKLREWAEKDKVSINQFIATAVSEKIAALSTLELLEARGRRASREKFEAALSQVPDVEPAPEDRLPAGHKKPGSQIASKQQRSGKR